MREDEATATKYITFVLGFYVGQVIKRWRDQVKDIPDIDSVTNCLVGFVQLEFKDEDEKKRKQAADDALVDIVCSHGQCALLPSVRP